jgi:hypothetical protein
VDNVDRDLLSGLRLLVKWVGVNSGKRKVIELAWTVGKDDDVEQGMTFIQANSHAAAYLPWWGDWAEG